MIFFGESLDAKVREEATRRVDDAEQLCVIGSSLATYSAFRLVRQAKDASKPIALLNVGDSRADGIADLRIGHTAGSSQILPPAVKKLSIDPTLIALLDQLCRNAIKKVSSQTTG